MEKKAKIILLTGVILAILFISVILFFIASIKTDDISKFYGTWKTEGVDPENGNWTAYKTFNRNGSLEKTTTINGSSFFSIDSWYLKNDQLIIEQEYVYDAGNNCDYQFSNDDKTLTLTYKNVYSGEEIKYVYSKILN